ncbi:MAG: protein kinase [Planctomycetota bacterium]
MSQPLSERALERLLAMAAEEPAAAPVPPLPERYSIVRELGRGGMGIVYEAFDRQLDRPCALKTMGAAAAGGDELRRRFVREAWAVARLRHPHIATVYDATPDYISMQLIRGVTIDVAAAGDPRRAARLLRDAARGVHHAHEQGLVHRDLKPSNVLVEGDHVYVVDFGLAKELTASSSLSLSGAVVGTLAYMPPEQARGRVGAVDARSDVYGLGATLHHCLCGRPPFVADDMPTLLRCVLEQAPRPTAVDRELDLVVGKCLAKEPERRYASAAELAEDLDRWLAQLPVQAQGPSWRYRLRKLLQRQRALWRAAGLAALLVALVLVPIALSEGAARSAAAEAVLLADHVAAVLDDAAAHYRFGENASAGEVLDGGIGRVEEFLRRHEVPRVRYLLGRLLRARGRDDDALHQLELALQGDAELTDARFERGLLLASRYQLTDAEMAMAIADLRAGGGERTALTAIDRMFGRAQLDRLLGQHEAAMALFREVLEYDPTHLAARIAMGRSAQALGQTDLQRYYTASAVDFLSGYGPVFVVRESLSLPTTVHGLDAALVDCAAQLLASHDHALGLAYRGLVQLRRAVRQEEDGKRDNALASALAAIADHDMTLTMHEGLAGVLVNRAVCHAVAARLCAASGDGAGAAEHRLAAERDLDAALTRAPDLPEAHFNLGVLHARTAALSRAMGRAKAAAERTAAARAEFDEALRCAPAGWQHERDTRRRVQELDAGDKR